MAQYTLTIRDIIESGINIFDFDYPTFNEDLKKEFEKCFIDHFYFDEIGSESVGRFKWLLKSKLNLIMPRYNKIFSTQLLDQRILDNYDITETFTKEFNGDSNSNYNSTSKNLFKDAPRTKIDIEKMDIVNSINKDLGEGTSNTLNKGAEKWERKMTGNIGVATDSDAIQSYIKSIRNVTEEIINDLEYLFMGVY